MPKTSDLTNRVTIQQATETRATDGGVLQTWGTWRTCYASVEPLTGREWYQAESRQATITTRIWVPWIDANGVTAKMRVLWGTRIFKIESVINPRERNEWIELMCIEEV